MQSVSDAATAFTFRMWWRTQDSAAWVPGHDLLVRVDDGETAVPKELSWSSSDGALSAIGFSPDVASCYGHRITASGDAVEVRGELRSQTGAHGAGDVHDEYLFDTEVDDATGWRPAGRLRLLIDDGAQAPLRWLAWHDWTGNTCSVALRSASPTGSFDITDMVTAVSASAEHRDAGEVAANLVDGTHSKWFAPCDRAFLEFRLSRPMVVNQYVLTSANDAPDRDPAAWMLRGSADGNLWRTLDTRTGQSFTERHQPRTYPIAKPGSHARYRLDIVSNNGSPDLQLAAVRILADSSGFTGYRQRTGHAPIAYRGSRVALESPGTPTGRDHHPMSAQSPNQSPPQARLSRPAVAAGTPQLPSLRLVPLVRTDFSDDDAWIATCSRVTAPRHFSDGDTFMANVEPVDCPAFADLTAEQLVELVPAGASWALLLIADTTTMESAEHNVLVVDLGDDSRGRTFRATPPAVHEVVNNLLLANMD